MEKYFSYEFIKGYGTENILELLDKYGLGGNWLDLSGGTNTLFWTAGTKKMTQLSGMMNILKLLKFFMKL